MNIDQDVHSTPPGIPPAPPPHPPRRKPPLIVLAAVAAAALALGGGIGFAAGHRPTPTTSGSAIPTTDSPAPPPALSPQAAQAKTCDVLRNGYETVANAIDERNKFKVNDWTDPALLTATNHLVTVSSEFARNIEGSLGTSTPQELRAAALDYVVGLRALSISERNHAAAAQLNGVGSFYNQVVDAPLRICGIPG